MIQYFCFLIQEYSWISIIIAENARFLRQWLNKRAVKGYYSKEERDAFQVHSNLSLLIIDNPQLILNTESWLLYQHINCVEKQQQNFQDLMLIDGRNQEQWMKRFKSHLGEGPFLDKKNFMRKVLDQDLWLGWEGWVW